MTFQEKSNWILVVVMGVVYGWYFAAVLPEARSTPVVDIEYQTTLLLMVIPLVVVAAIGHIVIAAMSPKDSDASDERDKWIDLHGNRIEVYVLSVGALGSLFLAMAEFEHFWIAHAILATLVLSEIIGGLTKIAFYRRGF